MRTLLPLLLALAACSAELPLLPDASACGGACGEGTECVDGRCVTLDGGAAADAADDTAPAPPSDACLETVWPDLDGDGFGRGEARRAACGTTPAGFARVDSDCDDRNPAAHPGAPESCNGVDEDCDGRADDDPLQVHAEGGGPPTDHPLTRWCEAQLARYPELAARARAFGGLRRCMSSRVFPGAAPYLSPEARCFAGDGSSTAPPHIACWRAAGEIPCR